MTNQPADARPSAVPAQTLDAGFCRRCGKTRPQHYGALRCYHDEDVQFLQPAPSAVPEETQPKECEHEWVMYMIQMPEGHAKPGRTVCTKCGIDQHPQPIVTMTTTADLSLPADPHDEALDKAFTDLMQSTPEEELDDDPPFAGRSDEPTSRPSLAEPSGTVELCAASGNSLPADPWATVPVYLARVRDHCHDRPLAEQVHLKADVDRARQQDDLVIANQIIDQQQTLQRMVRAGELLEALTFWPSSTADQNAARDIGRILQGKSPERSTGYEEAIRDAGAFSLAWKQKAEQADADLRAARAELERLRIVAEELAGWWELNREGSVNRAYAYLDETVERFSAALRAPATEEP